MRRTRVGAMNVMRNLLAGWAGRCRTDGLSGNGDGGLPDGDLLHFKTGQGKRKRMQEE